MTLSWMERRSLRLSNLFGFLACFLMLGAAYYMEHGMGLEPCPLCILQRMAVAGMAVIFIVAMLHGPKDWGRFVYGSLMLLAAGTGAAIAGRHIWLQSLPPEDVPACGPGLEYMMSTFPLSDVLRMVLQGSGECAAVHSVFGLSLPIWTLAGFIIVGLFGVWANLKPRQRSIWL
ncbi:disulfide bond formation protein B [Methylonatrum kenyense]|uniref:disulfide bond formation protein B n=1 Tax=Methylonatrum kenyense TaxID=455253 RepID=UPI0020BEDF11|nr:disulfide bond formation protein B [Methylonatrum kenyense]MCK8514896.1 disulfide bond formation protein B [Methylonatrum kenyense]